MKKLIISLLLGMFSTVVLADTITVKQQSVPIVVTDGLYTVEGPVPTGDYYYSYTGHRCFTVKREGVGLDAVIVKAKIPGGSDIYCYNE